MLSFVRSSESTMKGEVPPRKMYNNTPSDHMSVAGVMGSPFRVSGAEGVKVNNGPALSCTHVYNISTCV